MSILKTEIGTAIPNFLDSEVGLVTKTAQIPQSMGQADGDRKTVFAGRVPREYERCDRHRVPGRRCHRWRCDRLRHGCGPRD